MPMTWTPENNQKLLVEIMKVCEIKISGPQALSIASAFGTECTPKAIKEQIHKLRKLNPGTAAAVTGPPKTPTPRKKRSAGGRKGKVAEREDKGPMDDSEGEIGGGKMKRKMEDGDGDMVKRVKREGSVEFEGVYTVEV